MKENELKDIEELAGHLHTITSTVHATAWNDLTKYQRNDFRDDAKRLIELGYKKSPSVPVDEVEELAYLLRQSKNVVKIKPSSHLLNGVDVFQFNEHDLAEELIKEGYRKSPSCSCGLERKGLEDYAVCTHTQKLWDDLIAMTKRMEEAQKDMDKAISEFSKLSKQPLDEPKLAGLIGQFCCDTDVRNISVSGLTELICSKFSPKAVSEDEIKNKLIESDRNASSMTCFCQGPQNNEPYCPCVMSRYERNAKAIKNLIEKGE